MKLLVSAYACAPNRGSDHAVGWNWITQAHRLGHQIWALVSPAHHDAITTACRDDPSLSAIRWIFPAVGGWKLKPAIEPKWERTYNLLWQRAALRQALPLHRQVRFDAVHHLTWGGIRAPTFLAALEIPLIIGPIGGGETSPRALRRELGLRGKVLEKIRDVSGLIAVNPMFRADLRRAALIFAYTRHTQNLFTHALRDKTVVFSPLAITDLPVTSLRRAAPDPPRLLFAGRLLYWKGVHIALSAFAQLSRQHPGACFTIVGSGRERSRLEMDARRYGVIERVTFIDQLPQQQLFALYESHDLLLFPSLHDSGGFVVLEALSRGMPVACLDLGGPGDLVTAASGIVVATNGKTTAQVVESMADQIGRLFQSPHRMAELSTGAVSRAGEFILAERVGQFYGRVAAMLGSPVQRAANLTDPASTAGLTSPGKT